MDTTDTDARRSLACGLPRARQIGNTTRATYDSSQGHAHGSPYRRAPQVTDAARRLVTRSLGIQTGTLEPHTVRRSQRRHGTFDGQWFRMTDGSFKQVFTGGIFTKAAQLRRLARSPPRMESKSRSSSPLVIVLDGTEVCPRSQASSPEVIVLDGIEVCPRSQANSPEVAVMVQQQRPQQ